MTVDTESAPMTISFERRSQLLRPAQVMADLGLSRSTFYRLVNTGALPACRVGHSVRVPADALNAWVAAQVTSGTAAEETT